MLYLNLNGLTLPEMLIAMRDKINELIKEFPSGIEFIYTQEYRGEQTEYTISNLVSTENFKDGVLINFVLSSMLGVVRNVDANRGTFYVYLARSYKGLPGERGAQGEKGETGTPGRDGTNGVDGKNGSSITSIHSVSHSVVGNETVTKVEVTMDNVPAGVTNPQIFDVHAKNGVNGTSDQHLYFIVLKSVEDNDIPIASGAVLKHFYCGFYTNVYPTMDSYVDLKSYIIRIGGSSGLISLPASGLVVSAGGGAKNILQRFSFSVTSPSGEDTTYLLMQNFNGSNAFDQWFVEDIYFEEAYQQGWLEIQIIQMDND